MERRPEPAAPCRGRPEGGRHDRRAPEQAEGPLKDLSRRAPLLGWLLAAYGAWAIFVVALKVADVQVLDLFRDPTQLSDNLEDHPWKGGFSMLGNLAWAAASAVCLLAGAVLRARRESRSEFFLATGVVFAVLGFDDAFSIHDNFAVVLLGGAAELIVLSSIAVLFIAWAIRYRREIRESSYVMLGLGSLGLGIPFLLDARDVVGIDASWLGVVEEAAELAAILTLLLYASVESWRALVHAGRGAGATAG